MLRICNCTFQDGMNPGRLYSLPHPIPFPLCTHVLQFPVPMRRFLRVSLLETRISCNLRLVPEAVWNDRWKTESIQIPRRGFVLCCPHFPFYFPHEVFFLFRGNRIGMVYVRNVCGSLSGLGENSSSFTFVIPLPTLIFFRSRFTETAPYFVKLWKRKGFPFLDRKLCVLNKRDVFPKTDEPGFQKQENTFSCPKNRESVLSVFCMSTFSWERVSEVWDFAYASETHTRSVGNWGY